MTGTLVGDDVELQRCAGPMFGTPDPRLLPVSGQQLRRIDEVARVRRRHGGGALSSGGGRRFLNRRCHAGGQRYGQATRTQLDELASAETLVIFCVGSHECLSFSCTRVNAKCYLSR